MWSTLPQLDHTSEIAIVFKSGLQPKSVRSRPRHGSPWEWVRSGGARSLFSRLGTCGPCGRNDRG